MDDINHVALPKEAVRPNTPTSRPQKEDIWNHVRRITKHDVPDRGMKIDCTHVCVYPLEEGENGEKRYCNTPLNLFFVPLKLFRVSSFCECVLFCVKLVVSDLHVRLKVEEIRILVILRMNRNCMEYMRSSYPLSEFRAADTYVRVHGGVEVLEDDEYDT